MISNQSSPLPEPTDRLRQQIQEQMQREGLTLQNIQSALEQIQEALASGAPNLMAQIIEKQEENARQIENNQKIRERFCQEMSDSLQIASESITFSGLLEQIPLAQRKELLEMHRKLREQAENVEKLFNSNAILIFSGLDFLHRFFRDLSGGQESERYGADGKSGKSLAATLFELQG